MYISFTVDKEPKVIKQIRDSFDQRHSVIGADMLRAQEELSKEGHDKITDAEKPKIERIIEYFKEIDTQ